MKDEILDFLISIEVNNRCTDDELESTWEDVLISFETLLDKIDQHYLNDVSDKSLTQILVQRYNKDTCDVCGCDELLCGHNKRE
jgi:hypothetical protein